MTHNATASFCRYKIFQFIDIKDRQQIKVIFHIVCVFFFLYLLLYLFMLQSLKEILNCKTIQAQLFCRITNNPRTINLTVNFCLFLFLLLMGHRIEILNSENQYCELTFQLRNKTSRTQRQSSN